MCRSSRYNRNRCSYGKYVAYERGSSRERPKCHQAATKRTTRESDGPSHSDGHYRHSSPPPPSHSLRHPLLERHYQPLSSPCVQGWMNPSLPDSPPLAPLPFPPVPLTTANPLLWTFCPDFWAYYNIAKKMKAKRQPRERRTAANVKLNRR